MAGRLEGNVAIVTGGARGMGEAHARRFVREGASVLIGDILDTEGEAVAKELGDGARYVHLDVTEEAQWDEAVTIAQEFGALNVLVNNAGIVGITPLATTSRGDYQHIIDVNQTGVFLGMKAVIPAMSDAGGGSIVNISSVGGMQGAPGFIAYVASKFAVRGMTKVAALELASLNIRVNSVLPGRIATPMIQIPDLADVDVEAILSQTTPLRRLGRVEEIAELVLFLASDASSYCTGSEFVVDGGLTAGDAAADDGAVSKK